MSLFSLPLGGLLGTLCCGNYAHDPSGFDVPEHFREPEVLGQDNHGFLFWVLRLIGVHLFRFWLPAGVVRREASPPFRTTRRAVSRVPLAITPLPVGWRDHVGYPL